MRAAAAAQGAELAAEKAEEVVGSEVVLVPGAEVSAAARSGIGDGDGGDDEDGGGDGGGVSLAADSGHLERHY